MKRIKSKILVIMLAIILLISGVLGAMGCWLIYSASMDTLEKSLTETARITGDRVRYELESYRNIAQEVGCMSDLGSNYTTDSRKQMILTRRCRAYGFLDQDLLTTDGISIYDGKSFADKPYFQQAMQGESVISDPFFDEESGQLTFIICAPLWDGGVASSSVVGVVCFTPNTEFLNDIVRSIQVGETGSAYILDGSGTTIAHKNSEIVGKENTLEAVKSDSSLAEIAALEQRMVDGENAFGHYTYGGVAKVMSFAPIAGTNGWSIAITAETSDFLQGVYNSIISTIIVVAFFIAAGILISLVFAGRITRPLRQCTDRLRLLAKGDVTTPAPRVKAKDETGMLAEGIEIIVVRLGGLIEDVAMLLGRMASGDFKVESQAEEHYVGDFEPMLRSINQIISSLNITLAQINRSAEQVSSGSGQVSAGAQALAQGATEQASTVEELSAAIYEVSEQVGSNAKNSRNVNEKVNQVASELQSSNEQMQALMQAMRDINASSSEIGKIIKTIEDIAFQTNILALNAAVEAARAGNAGKGFAVVADEVRNLASKSAAAAKHTTELIEKSVRAVESGSRIANQTADSLQAVVRGAMEISQSVEEIAKASAQQSDSLAQVTAGVEQISSVVQTNSATAEQSAAASEELSGQAQLLKEMVGRFQLKDVDAEPKPVAAEQPCSESLPVESRGGKY